MDAAEGGGELGGESVSLEICFPRGGVRGDDIGTREGVLYHRLIWLART